MAIGGTEIIVSNTPPSPLSTAINSSTPLFVLTTVVQLDIMFPITNVVSKPNSSTRLKINALTFP